MEGKGKSSASSSVFLPMDFHRQSFLCQCSLERLVTRSDRPAPGLQVPLPACMHIYCLHDNVKVQVDGFRTCRHIDCAAVYGNQDEIGAALQKVFAEGKIKRRDVWITSKACACFHSIRTALPPPLSMWQ